MAPYTLQSKIYSYYFTLYTAYVRYNLRPTWFPYVQKRVGTKDQNGHQQWLINQTMNSNTRKGERERFIWKNMTSPQPTVNCIWNKSNPKNRVNIRIGTKWLLPKKSWPTSTLQQRVVDSEWWATVWVWWLMNHLVEEHDEMQQSIEGNYKSQW